MTTGAAPGRRMLVIDDDEVMRELLSALLKVKDYDVEVASSGDEALGILRGPDPPLLVLTDLQMPGLEGEVLTRSLRDTAPPAALIVGMSGRRPADAVLHFLDAFLPKPFEPAEIENAFAAARRTREAHPELRSALQNSASALEPDAEARANEPALDDTIFNALTRSFGPAQLMELYQLTLDDVAKRHARMTAHFDQGDLDEVRREAHAIKGACGMVGARELQRLATVIEKGTSLSNTDLLAFPVASDRLRRMLDEKLQQKW